jgi:osmoprotectant transport system substrate-binding protein
MRVPRLGRVAALVVAASVLATSCGGDDDTGGAGGAASKGRVTVGSGGFSESQIIANMYSQALKKAGFEVTDKFKIGEREVYLRSMQNNEIDVAPEYLGSLTGYLNNQDNGPNAEITKPLASGDVEKTLANLQPLLQKRQLAVGTPSSAVDQNAYAVPKELADREGLKTMSDLAKLNGTLVLGGPPVCPKRRECLVGLQQVYGLKFKEFKPLGDISGPQIFGALEDGTIQVGTVLSSDGTVAANGLIVLEDDKKLQNAENVLALYRESVPQEARDVVERVNKALTTEKLQELNKKYNQDGEDPEDLARQFLEDAGLL